MPANAQVVGKVEYRAGDGPSIVIPPGPIEVQLSFDSAVLSWGDEGAVQTTALPIAEYQRYVAEGAIVEGKG
ncbi:hypothetical protein QTH97_18980 [Variovorax sp. J22R24]|uniref:hypothetical protein n=1 Tax=Variovorax gracilis TaxID=3053502 RepID=UPI0025784DBD|nr:hypothetical protein [Variovorax sp. J22R24]MDM0107038.1 hypothetical protein [Variovorax sp. J22R24]